MNQTNYDLEQLFESTAPKPRPVDTREITSLDVPRNNSRNRVVRAYALLLAVAASVVIALGVIPLWETPSNSAFAQAIDNIQKIKAVSYFQTSYIVVQPNETEGQTLFSKPKDASAKRTKAADRSFAPAIAKLEDAGNPSLLETDIDYAKGVMQDIAKASQSDRIDDLRWIRIKDKHLQRTDNFFPHQGHHSVINAAKNQHVAFDHSNKLREAFKQQVVIDRETKKRTEHAIRFSPAVDFFKRLRSVPDDAVELKEHRTWEGQEAVGFQTIQEHNGTWTRTYWIGIESQLPIRIVTVYESDDERIVSSKWVQSHFVYNEDLPDSLFSTEAPDGYTSKDAEIHAFR